jgi:hypothetical protein
MMGADDPLTKMINAMKQISGVEGINKANIEKFSEALSVYTIVMAKGAATKGVELGAEVANFVGSAVQSFTKFLGGEGAMDSMITGMKKLSAEDISKIDKEKIKKVGEALSVYATTMAEGLKSSTADMLLNITTLVTHAVTSFSEFLGFEGGIDSMITGMKKLSAEDVSKIDTEKMRTIANALGVYAEAMGKAGEASKGTVWGAIGDLVKGIIGSIGDFLGFGDDKGAMDKLKEFASVGLTDPELDQIRRNASAFEIYSEAMSSIGSSGEFFAGGDIPDLKEFAEKLESSAPALNRAMEQFGDPALFENYSQSGKNLGALFGAFKDIEGLGSSEFMGSKDFEYFAKDLVLGMKPLQVAIGGDVDDGILGLASSEIKWAEAAENISVLLNALGGTRGAGDQINAAGVTRMTRDQGLGGAPIVDASVRTIAPVTTNNAHFTPTSLEDPRQSMWDTAS